ncbi:MAG: FAD-binding protein [Bacteroidales bacterium]|nr:FAD-binding protein [Bacteroidales bacterium]
MKKTLGILATALILCGCAQDKTLTFTPGSYEKTVIGYNGPLSVRVTFSDSCITDINILSHEEMSHVGSFAFDELIPQIKEANGVGVDAVSGATITSIALMNAVTQAAEEAGVSNMEQFRKNRVDKVEKDIEDTWDVVIIGAGGAGLAAAAEAAGEGNTVLVIEKNGEMGGNTLVSAGIYQSVVPYLVWDSSHPDATQGLGYDGEMHPKVKMGTGCIRDLNLILGWSEEIFDSTFYRTHDFVPGDIVELSKHGVHPEYLPTLKALKHEINAYMAWAKPKMAKGVPETQLTLFSTKNLHLFQTYYGGLRNSAETNKWSYSEFDLAKQVVEEGEALKPWLSSMGIEFHEQQLMMSGEMWFRGNKMDGAKIDTDGDGEPEYYEGNWGSYVMAPYHTLIKANKKNQVMKSTTAYELIMKGNRVTGVTAQKQSGAKVIAHAKKGVIIASGGYAANINKVINTNIYWKKDLLSPRMGSTNRSSMRGDGIEMAQDMGASVTGMGWTQLMPMSYADDGSIAFGSVSDGIFINPNSGKRFVDESSDRDVLAEKCFKYGMAINGQLGSYLFIGGETTSETKERRGIDIPGKQYARTIHQLPELIKSLKLPATPSVIEQTIRSYDEAIMAGKEPDDVPKKYASSLIGRAKKNDDGSYDASTYSLDSVMLTIRVLAPSTHHTMGGLKIDAWRRVLDNADKPIPGLYAAGEVTGGIHGGNRLGGNALTEILVSGRIAARSVNKFK